jgi:predicted RNA-binding Zn-ribbon protein involved in translation (DUF1610 family)
MTDVGSVTPLARTLDQELLALSRGASLECPACGEFVLHRAGAITCPECGLRLESEPAPELQLTLQAG